MKKYLLITSSLLFITASLFSQTFTCGDTLLDIRDGQKYPTVLIGSQCWMKQNLNYGQYMPSVSTGTPHSDVSNNSIVEKYCFGNLTSNCAIYGGLYDWSEMMNYTTVNGGQGICPNGWHIPSTAEYSVLATYVANSGNALKKVGQGAGAGAGTNTSGFSALLGGDRGSPGVFTGATFVGIFWASTQTSSTDANHIYLIDVNDSLKFMNTQKFTGFSCRCVRNAGAGIEEGSLKNQFNVYPNPTNGILNITATDFKGELKVSVKDVSGREILVVTSKQIDISDLESGLYLLQISNAKTGEQLGVKRIVKD